MVLRFLYANGFKMDKTLASISAHTKWREATLPIQLDESIKNLLVNYT